MDILLAFYLAHLIGDFIFQTNWVYQQKITSWKGGVFHSGGILLAQAIVFWPIFFKFLPLFVGITCIHYLQDGIKLIWNDISEKHIVGYFIDQSFHLFFSTAAWFSFFYFTTHKDFWLPIEYSILGIALIGVTYFWDVTKYILSNTPSTYRRNYLWMIARSILVLLCFLFWKYINK